MASPFKHFRKHQKAMLAVIGILTMLAFTILPSVMDQMGSAMSTQDPIVATANGNAIRETDLQQMRRAKALANRFVAGCLQMALKEQFFMARFQYGDLLEQFFGEPTDESVVETRLLAERADQIGLIISDDAVNEFLRGLTQDKISAAGYKSLVKELGTTQAQLFNALRTELAAQRLREMSMPSGQPTPAQRWDYYRRLKQRAVVEVAPVFVAEFADEVADPSPEELARFFDAHKEQEPRPLSPTPGFKVPKQAAFQYFVADYSKFYDEAAVTQEEIEKHYEQYKDQRYLYSSFDSPESDASEGQMPKAERGAEDAEKPAADDKPDDDDGKDEAKKPAAEGDKAPENKPDDSAAPSSDKTPPADKKSDDEKKSTTDEKDEQSSVTPAVLQLLAADSQARPSRALAGLIGSLLFADEQSEEAKAEDSAEKAAGEAEDKPAEKPAAAPQDAAAKDAEEPSEPAKQESATDGKGPGAVKKAPTGPPPPISDDLLLPGDIREGAKPKYAPLWKVEASIRKELAGQKAVELMTKAFAPIQTKMSRFTRNLDPDEQQPKLPQLSALAKEQNLTEHTTELLTGLAFKEQHPGLADATPDQQSFNERPQHFVDIGYGNMAVFQSAVVKDLEGNRYLAWKIDGKEAYVPELSEVRDEVVQRWKLIQARDLARKRAQSLVDKARETDKPLADAFGAGDGVRATTTPAFSWLSRGSDLGMLGSQAPATLSEVEGVQDAGPDFMREVFSLSVGDVGLAMNQPQTICYVIRLDSLKPSREVLRDLFMIDAYSTYEAAASDDRNDALRAWVKGIETEAHLEWKPSPERLQAAADMGP